MRRLLQVVSSEWARQQIICRVQLNGELHEVEQMYRAYMNAAEFQDEAGAKRSFHGAWEAEKLHAALFQMALDAVNEGRDIELKAIYVCGLWVHCSG